MAAGWPTASRFEWHPAREVPAFAFELELVLAEGDTCTVEYGYSARFDGHPVSAIIAARTPQVQGGTVVAGQLLVAKEPPVAPPEGLPRTGSPGVAGGGKGNWTGPGTFSMVVAGYAMTLEFKAVCGRAVPYRLWAGRDEVHGWTPGNYPQGAGMATHWLPTAVSVEAAEVEARSPRVWSGFAWVGRIDAGGPPASFKATTPQQEHAATLEDGESESDAWTEGPGKYRHELTAPLLMPGHSFGSFVVGLEPVSSFRDLDERVLR